MYIYLKTAKKIKTRPTGIQSLQENDEKNVSDSTSDFSLQSPIKTNMKTKNHEYGSRVGKTRVGVVM